MGEEEKKTEHSENPAKEDNEQKEKDNPEDKKSDSEDGKSKSEDSSKTDPPPPPPEIVLKVYMHCEGCATKIHKYLKGFPGVEEVKTDIKISQVIVKGEKADPIKVLERVQKKSNREVELISPVPAPAPEPAKEETPKNPVEKETEKKKEELLPVSVVLGVYMHCDACAQEIKRRILRMKGVESVVPDLKNSKVTVKGIFSPEILVDYIFRRTAKHATIISAEMEKKEEEKPKEEKKPEESDKEKNKNGDPPEKDGAETEESKLDVKKNEIYYLYPQNFQIYPHRVFQEGCINLEEYPPQMFSDENPNACSVM